MKPEIEAMHQARKEALSGEHRGILVEEHASAEYDLRAAGEMSRSPVSTSDVTYAGQHPAGGAFPGAQARGNALGFDDEHVSRDAADHASRTMAVNLSDNSLSSRKPIGATPISDMAQPISHVSKTLSPEPLNQTRARAMNASRSKISKPKDRFLYASLLVITILCGLIVYLYRAKHR